MVQQRAETGRGASISEQPTIGGIVVHLLGLIFGVVGAGVVYLLSNAEFTRQNARHALNWQLLFIGVVLIALVLAFGLGTLVSDLFVFPAALLIIIVGLLDFVFCLWATRKAITGSEWQYPLAPTFV